MAARTRSFQHVWLIGFPSDKIISAKLPSGRDAMCFFIKPRENKCTIRESAHTTYDELIKIWDQCRIPVKSKRDIIDKIENSTSNNKCFRKASSVAISRQEKPGSVLNQTRLTVWHSSCSRKLLNSVWRGQAVPGSAADKSYWEYRGDRFLTSLARRAVGRKTSKFWIVTILCTRKHFTSQEIGSKPDETTSEDMSNHEAFTYNSTVVKKQRIISQKINAVLDRANTSVRKASMITASVLNRLVSL